MTTGETSHRSWNPSSLLVAAAIVIALTRCTGSAQPAAPAAAAQGVAVDVQPKTAQVATGGAVSFAATVTGSADTTVTWDVVEAAGGTVSATGLYTAPSTAGTFHVRASSHASPSIQSSSAVTVTAPPPPPPPPPPVVVTVSPSPGAVAGCKTLQLTATVTGTTNGAVTWAVQETGGGTVSTSGLYTAPSTAGTYHVVATSAASTGSTVTVPVTVSDSILGVTVSPATASLAPGATAQFTATVTTTCGSFASVQTVTAPLQ